MEHKSLEALSQRLESAAGQVSHVGTTGGARVQLQLVQELESVLTSPDIDAATLKDASHGVMTSLLRMLENGLAGPIRASVLRCLHVIFSADPIRATLAHGQVSEFLQAQAKAYTQAGSSAVVGMLEVLALHAYMCALTNISQTVTTTTVVKALVRARTTSTVARAACMKTLASVARGIGFTSGPAASPEVANVSETRLKDLLKALKECETAATTQCTSSHPSTVRAAAFEAVSSLAEISAPLLFDNRGSRWDALCTLCRRALLEPDMHAHEARHAACLALGALVASPWAADFAEAEEHSDAEASGIGASEASTSTDVGVGSVGERAGQQKDAQAVVLKKLREKGFQKQLLAPLGQAAIAEDRDSVFLFATATARALELIQGAKASYAGAVRCLVLSIIQEVPNLLPPLRSGSKPPLMGSGEAPLLQAALIYIVRSAALPNLDGMQLRTLLGDLGNHCVTLVTKKAESPKASTVAQMAGAFAVGDNGCNAAATATYRRTPEAVVLFSTLSGVLLALGEVPRATARDLRDAVHRVLIQSAGAAAYAAAGVLGQLAAVDGESASELMMEYMSLATLQAASFGSKSAGRRGAALPLLSSGDGSSTATWEQAFLDLQGCVLAGCALMGAVSLLPLGCPSKHLQEFYSSAVRMVAQPLASGDDAHAHERRLGCLMLSCLSCNLPLGMLEACEEQIFDTLATHAFGNAACAALSVPPAAASATTSYATFLREASWRTAALEALRSWLIGYVAFLPRTRQKHLSHKAADALAPLLALIAAKESSLPPDAPKTPPDVVLALRTLTDGILSAYLCIPTMHAFTAQWGDIVSTCLEPLREGRPWLTPATRRAVHCRLLTPLLNSQDTAIAPYLQCRQDEGFLPMVHSPLGEALATFAGEPGGPQTPAWQLRPPMPPQSEQAPRVMHAPPPLPQPLSAGASLAITQLQLLGRVFAVLDEESQHHVLLSLTAALAAEALPSRKAPRTGFGAIQDAYVPLRVPGICAVALIGLSQVAKSCKATGRHLPKLSEISRDLALSLLAVGPPATRAGIEILSFSAVMGGDSAARFTAKLACVRLNASAPAGPAGAYPPSNPPSSGAGGPGDPRPWALALGATQRSAGGVTLQPLLAEIVTALTAYARNDVAMRAATGAPVFALHALYLVMASAFGASQWVEVVMDAALDAVLRGGAAAAAAAVVTALVEVQGPEFCPSSRTHPLAEAILAAVSGDDWTFDERPAAEETELMRQRVWGARNVISLATDVPKHAFLAVLLANLQAPVLVLRGVAAAALHQLSSTNLDLLAAERAQEPILAAINTETDLQVRTLLKDVIHMLATHAARSPRSAERWIELLATVVSGTPKWLQPGAFGGTMYGAHALRSSADRVRGGLPGGAKGGLGMPRRRSSTPMPMMRNQSFDARPRHGVVGAVAGPPVGGQFGEHSRGHTRVESEDWDPGVEGLEEGDGEFVDGVLSGNGGEQEEGGKHGRTKATLATRSFALHCLVMLLDTITADAVTASATAPPIAAAALLQSQAQAIVQCAFEAIEDSTAETLKPPSLLVLCRLLQSAQTVSKAVLAAGSAPETSVTELVGIQSSHSLGNVPEDSDEPVPMDVYAAPYVTALKTCLKPDAPVAIATASVRLAEAVLTSGMLHEDGPSVQMLIRRLVAFVVDFEASKDASEAQHAEWVSTCMRVAVLNALSNILLSPVPCTPPPNWGAQTCRSPVAPTLNTPHAAVGAAVGSGAGTVHTTSAALQSPPPLAVGTPTQRLMMGAGEGGLSTPGGMLSADFGGASWTPGGMATSATDAATGAEGAMVPLSEMALADMHASGTAALVLQWLRRLCSDATILLLERPAMHQKLNSPMLPSVSSFTVSKVVGPLATALPPTMHAACGLLPHLPTMLIPPSTPPVLFHLAAVHSHRLITSQGTQAFLQLPPQQNSSVSGANANANAQATHMHVSAQGAGVGLPPTEGGSQRGGGGDGGSESWESGALSHCLGALCCVLHPAALAACTEPSARDILDAFSALHASCIGPLCSTTVAHACANNSANPRARIQHMHAAVDRLAVVCKAIRGASACIAARPGIVRSNSLKLNSDGGDDTNSNSTSNNGAVSAQNDAKRVSDDPDSSNGNKSDSTQLLVRCIANACQTCTTAASCDDSRTMHGTLEDTVGGVAVELACAATNCMHAAVAAHACSRSISQSSRLLSASVLSFCNLGLLNIDTCAMHADACMECMRTSAATLRGAGTLLTPAAHAFADAANDEHACTESVDARVSICECIERFATACGGGGTMHVPLGGQKLLFCGALALVDAWPQSGAQQCEYAQKACRACIDAFSGAVAATNAHKGDDTSQTSQQDANKNDKHMHVAALLAALRMHAKACAADMLSLSGVVMPLLPLLATVGQEHSAAAAADKANHLHMQKELWNLLITLVTKTSGDAQLAIYGVLLSLLMDAMSPPDTTLPDPALVTAAYGIFKAGLQSPKLAHMLPTALGMLTPAEKARLREGVRAAEGGSAGGGAASGARGATPIKPTINFAAFKPK